MFLRDALNKHKRINCLIYWKFLLIEALRLSNGNTYKKRTPKDVTDRTWKKNAVFNALCPACLPTRRNDVKVL